MKRAIIWIIAVISLIISAIALYFMPDAIPLHYGPNAAIDRWGSKYETLIFPAIMLFLAIFFTLSTRYYEKKAQKAAIDQESAYHQANAKAHETIGVAIMALFTAMQGVLLYGAHNEALTGAIKQLPGATKITFILLGLIFIILGNFMTKTRNNGTFGIRIKWSRYNDNTWRKSNRFGALAIMTSGALIIGGAMLLPSIIIVTAPALIIVAIIATIIYARKVYLAEIASEKGVK